MRTVLAACTSALLIAEPLAQSRPPDLSGRWQLVELMISRSTTRPPDERGVRTTLTRGSMWRLEAPNSLVIELGEERAGERPTIATRTYVKMAPQ
jgi:hypothetical protein